MPDSFDEAFPGGFEECVRRMGQEPSVDDPEALCGWLQENGFEALAEASDEVTDVLLNLEVEFVSVVDEPAQDSEWLLAKSADADPEEWTPGENVLSESSVLLKQDPDDDEDADEDDDEDEPERKVWAAVLEPRKTDAQGDIIPDPEIEETAHNYLKNYRKVDEDHNLLDGSGVPIESYIIRDGPETFTLPNGQEKTHPEGTWIMGVELTENAWKRVEEGELTGFSIYGGASSLDPETLLSEEQVAALSKYRELQKQVPEEVEAALQAFVSTRDPSEATFVEFVEFLVEETDTDELDLGDITVESDEDGDGDEDEDDPEETDDDEEDDEQDKAKTDPADSRVDAVLKQVTKMGETPDDDENGEQETNEKLDQILEKVEKAATSEEVEEVRKSVSSVQERVEDLEEWKKSVTGASEEGGSEETPEDDEGDELTTEEVEELAADAAEDAAEQGAEKALTKFLGLDEDELPEDPDEREEVVRKGVRTIGGETEEQGETISTSNAGIMEEI